MQIKFYLVLRALVVITWIFIEAVPLGHRGAEIDAAERNRISKEMWQKVRERRLLAVIIQLNVPWKPRAQLTPEERTAQGEAIIAAQDQLLAELTGTQYSLIRRLNYSAALALDVGPDALAVLENSSLVRTVIEDIPVPPK
jgi:hypothetical protein